MYTEATRNEYTISTDSAKLDIAVIHGYLSNDSYWAQHIPIETVQRSINHSLCFGLYAADRQVGFARVVTDRATFAYLADVFILPGHRGKGLSKWLVSEIHAHPDLQGLRRWLLGTKDAHGLYRQFGWTSIPEEIAGRFMQLHNPDVYSR
ncbi:GNAT family N-acetyltransferase [Sediminibacterium soli]|uniref:GNAT family N-acetyltransferase n=1 Tax=Sediminibacterium soli TaxID=2698829 RepID=UPI00137AC573|nr:GNAT family N-acetyltransferase [Sediminibacterium soli]NCI45137.1 GNAT family N-acetyltransferase [Sediminibacterium soli]